MKRGASAKNRNLAHWLRKSPTLAELAAWRFLRMNRCVASFTRSCPVCGYVVDFGCRRLKLAIEIDGYVHDTEEAVARDLKRDFHLGLEGWAVVRLRNDLVLNYPDRAQAIVIECIERKAADRGLVGRIHG